MHKWEMYPEFENIKSFKEIDEDMKKREKKSKGGLKKEKEKEGEKGHEEKERRWKRGLVKEEQKLLKLRIIHSVWKFLNRFNAPKNFQDKKIQDHRSFKSKRTLQLSH